VRPTEEFAVIWDNTRAGKPAEPGNFSLRGSVMWHDEDNVTALDDSPESLVQCKRPACGIQFTKWHVFSYL